ncbi:hypothetical protein RhiirA1_401472 [Rhizophagus irregularis]|uniref:Uncharacterized protein n=1 Tax=Rhizophagus irregularis TaxID=588596 RepID=A0A2N0R220_9GLOM|nr:hypothetical protein RhiirA1_401472 [Rhizophagus irregularis]
MESYRGQEDFEEQLLREVKTFVTKNFKEAQLRQKEELDDTFDKIFFRTLKTHRLLVEISDITERLQKESDHPYTLSNNNPFLKEYEDKSPLSESSDDDECLKDVKKHIKKKQGARSSDSEDDSTIDSSSEVEKKMELQPENKPDTDKINKTPLEGFSRVVKKVLSLVMFIRALVR